MASAVYFEASSYYGACSGLGQVLELRAREQTQAPLLRSNLGSPKPPQTADHDGHETDINAEVMSCSR